MWPAGTWHCSGRSGSGRGGPAGLGDRSGPRRTAAALATAVFAAQLFNVPILPFSSAHLIGGVLLAWVLGPPLGLVCMTIVLTLQAVLLGDGGLLALGANIVNMGLVPAAMVSLAERWGFRQPGGRTSGSNAAALGAVALLATLAGAGLIVLEVALGRSTLQLDGWNLFAGRMLATHALAGALEAAATVALVGLLELAHTRKTAPITLSSGQALALAAASLAVVLASLPGLGLAASAPDAYASSLAAVGQAGHALGDIESPAHLSGIALTIDAWQQTLTHCLALPEAVVAVLGALLSGLGAARMRG